MSAPQFSVVGIGADGWDGLSPRARRAIAAADEVVGSSRQLSSLPASAPPRRAWPSPLRPLLEEILTRPGGHTAILASGDPMQFGIGATIVARLGADAVQSGRVEIISAPSAAALALARLGWPGDGVPLISTVGRPVGAVGRLLQPGRRFLVYVPGSDGASAVARALAEAGFGASPLWLLEQLGAPAERVHVTTAAEWAARADPRHDPLTTLAVEVVADPGARFHPVTPGLPDAAFSHDGQVTKRHVRAAVLAALAPAPGQLLWDLGAGSGSISIEWLRAEPGARAIAIERDAARAARAAANAEALGVPGLAVLTAAVPEALEGLPGPPDAVFIGGGLASGVLERAWERLAAGGRLVANAVTIEGEQLLVEARRAHGGELVRLDVAHADALGAFSAWRPALPIVQWAAHKA